MAQPNIFIHMPAPPWSEDRALRRWRRNFSDRTDGGFVAEDNVTLENLFANQGTNIGPGGDIGHVAAVSAGHYGDAGVAGLAHRLCVGLAPKFVGDNDLGGHRADQHQQPNSLGAAVEHIGPRAKVRSWHAVSAGRKFGAFVNHSHLYAGETERGDAAAELTRQVAENGGLAATGRGNYQGAGNPARSGHHVRGDLVGGAADLLARRIFRAEMFLRVLSSPPAKTPGRQGRCDGAGHGQETLTQFFFVSVKGIAADELKGFGHILAAGDVGGRLIGRPAGAVQKHVAVMRHDLERLAALTRTSAALARSSGGAARSAVATAGASSDKGSLQRVAICHNVCPAFLYIDIGAKNRLCQKSKKSRTTGIFEILPMANR
jgi:hypothetical protein